jgi:Txe/YoeB family toxin of Txe-Axe toxin-antitoxin module
MKPKELKLTELFLNELFKDAWKYLGLFTGKLEYKGENIQCRRCYITFRIIYMIHTWRMNNPKFQIPSSNSQF